MKKRHFERIEVNVPVSFFCDNALYTGMVTDLSKNGMYIETEMCLPFKSKFNLFLSSRLTIDFLIPSKDGNLEVPVKVTRLVKTEGHYHGMGVELINSTPPENYLDFIGNLFSSP